MVPVAIEALSSMKPKIVILLLSVSTRSFMMQTLIHACTLLFDSNSVLLSKLTLYIIDINKSGII